ncbi:hypothetical protein J4438_00985 [Candidatus Woesearchaeota archaeon]|nr:hypothetical protein [Candidatus Woesearchaeota archaeon]
MSNSILVPQYGMGITQREMGLRRKWIDEPHHLDRYRLVMPVVPVFTRHFLNMIEAYNGNFELRPSDNFENSKLYGKRVRNLYDYFVIGNNGGSDTFLDAYFEPNEDGFMGLQVKSEHRFECGTVVAKNVELLEECLDQICFADLDSLNEQGFPTKMSEVQKYERGKNIYFVPPESGKVVRFRSYPVNVLNCRSIGPDDKPTNMDYRLGVLGCSEIPGFAQRWANSRSRKVYK